jgi:hypothetical protein
LRRRSIAVATDLPPNDRAGDDLALAPEIAV